MRRMQKSWHMPMQTAMSSSHTRPRLQCNSRCHEWRKAKCCADSRRGSESRCGREKGPHRNPSDDTRIGTGRGYASCHCNLGADKLPVNSGQSFVIGSLYQFALLSCPTIFPETPATPPEAAARCPPPSPATPAEPTRSGAVPMPR